MDYIRLAAQDSRRFHKFPAQNRYKLSFVVSIYGIFLDKSYFIRFVLTEPNLRYTIDMI